MKLWFTNTLDALRGTFWFLPSLMVVAAMLLSLLTIRLDNALADHNWLATLGWTFSRGPEGSRAVLATVAASMMTIASVSFSITVVALQLASTQFGPRLLRNFMRDRGNQLAIGAFIATFTYCLLILRTVNGTENEQFVPHLSVTVGLILALMSVGVLIYFIHHSAESIQAENVIAAVSRELHHTIDRLFPQQTKQDPSPDVAASLTRDLPEQFERDNKAIRVRGSDYLQAIDVDALFKLAIERDLVLSLQQRPGQFYHTNDVLARVWPADRVDDDATRAIQGAFYLGSRRTLVQDVEFAFDQLVEVAVRALSPGVNDPFTAMNCIDRIGAALCVLAGRVLPSEFHYDEQGTLRVVAEISTISGIVDASFNQIRQAARGITSVSIRLLESIQAIGRHTADPAFRAALARQAEAIHRGAQKGVKDEDDRAEAEKRYRDAINVLEGNDPDQQEMAPQS